jgi:hypothetical protein
MNPGTHFPDEPELIAAVKSRFTRQADSQLDTIHSIEKRHSEDFRQLSRQLATPARRILAAGDARPPRNHPAQEIAVPTTLANQLFCLD